jgi:hypothetical protein
MKKLLATILALVMALGLCSVSWAAETGYKNLALPTAPNMSGAIVEVNAENAQYTLDGAYGSINGKTIKFTESIPNVLVLGRPTKYAGSNTKYYVGGFDKTGQEYKEFATAAELVAYKSSEAWTPGCYYSRAISNVTFTAGANVTLAGFTLEGSNGHIYATEAKPVYDYVRDSGTECVDANNGYYGNLNLENITFDGLTVNSTSGFTFYFMTTSVTGAQNKVDGLTFKNCKITSSDKGITDFMNNGGTADIFSNISFDNCELTVSGSNQENTYGVYMQGVSNVTVNKCKLAGMTRAIQNVAGGTEGNVQQPSGTFTVTNNEFNNITAYIIRGESTAALTDLTVTGNTSKDSGDSSKLKFGEAQSYEGSGKTAIYNNSWDGNVSHTHEWSKDTGAPQPEQKPSNNYYYYSSATDTTSTTKGSPKTFDAGVGIYAVTAVLSVTGMAWTAKKRH